MICFWIKLKFDSLNRNFMLYIARCWPQWWLNVMLYYRHMRTYGTDTLSLSLADTRTQARIAWVSQPAISKYTLDANIYIWTRMLIISLRRRICARMRTHFHATSEKDIKKKIVQLSFVLTLFRMATHSNIQNRTKWKLFYNNKATFDFIHIHQSSPMEGTKWNHFQLFFFFFVLGKSNAVLKKKLHIRFALKIRYRLWSFGLWKEMPFDSVC